MAASDVASRHSRIQVLEVSSVELRPFLGYLDCPRVCCIHTTVRMVGGQGAWRGPSHIYKQVQHVSGSQAGSGDKLTHSWRV